MVFFHNINFFILKSIINLKCFIKKMGWIKKDTKLIWKYHTLIILILSVILAIFLLKSEFIKTFILRIGYLEYFGIFISGAFFTYGLTTAPAISMLYLFSRSLHPIDVAAFGAIGALLSDFLIFRLVKYNLSNEIKKLADSVKFHPHLNKSYMKILRRFAPLIAGFIIASPLPDELAASILGSIKVKDKTFIIISLVSNFIGILVISLLP